MKKESTKTWREQYGTFSMYTEFYLTTTTTTSYWNDFSLLLLLLLLLLLEIVQVRQSSIYIKNTHLEQTKFFSLFFLFNVYY